VPSTGEGERKEGVEQESPPMKPALGNEGHHLVVSLPMVWPTDSQQCFLIEDRWVSPSAIDIDRAITPTPPRLQRDRSIYASID